MPRCSAAGFGFIIVPAGFNAPLEFLTGFTSTRKEYLQYPKVDPALSPSSQGSFLEFDEPDT